MTDQELKGNRIIAEYCNFQHPTNEFTKLKHPLETKDFMFHASFDWLCPVAKRAMSDIIIIMEKNVDTEEQYDLYNRAKFFKTEFHLALCAIDIKKLFDITAAAIEFLNEVKQNL